MSIEYFMDKLQPYEIDIILDNLDYTNRLEWEQTRSLCYITAQVNSTKKLSTKDIMTFPWDQQDQDKAPDTVDDINKVKNKAKEFESFFNSKKINQSNIDGSNSKNR